jgi:glycosyltransferase involved in cell wall biosynthesis
VSFKITVIVPVFNGEKYLSRCLDSILCQTFGDIEILCINDGSTDNSIKIIKEYQKKDHRIRLISNNTNKGPSYSRNLGIERANTKLIGFVDCDDTIHPKMYEKLYNKTSETDSDISYCNFNYLNKDGDIKKSNLRFSEVVANEDFFKLLLENYLSPSACMMLVKKEIIVKNNIVYPLERFYEDASTAYKINYYCKKISVCHEPLYNYYDNEDSITTKITTKNILDIIESILDSINFLETNNLHLKHKESISIRTRNLISYQITKIIDNIENGEQVFDLIEELFVKIIEHKIHLKTHHSILLIWIELAYKALGYSEKNLLLLIKQVPDIKRLIHPLSLETLIESLNSPLGLSNLSVFKLLKDGVNNVYLYGAGEVARKVITKLESLNIKINGIYDRKAVVGEKLLNYDLLKPNSFVDYSNVFITSESSAFEIKKYLLKSNHTLNVYAFYDF